MANGDVSTGTGPLRRKTLTAHNEGTMRTVVDCGEAGRLILDGPVPHGGTGGGPTPLQAVLGALCGCEAVTFRRTAAELGLAYSALDFEAAFTTTSAAGRATGQCARTSRPCGCVPSCPPPGLSRSSPPSSTRPRRGARC
jgi:hypothetical protein